MNSIIGYVGTYGDHGIYEIAFDPKSMEFMKCETYRDVEDAKYLSVYREELVYPCMKEYPCIVYEKDGTISTVGKEEHVSCYVAQDDAYIYSCNYHDGTLIRYKKQATTCVLDKVITIQEKAGTHMVILSNKDVLVMNCLLDTMHVYDRTTLKLKQIIQFPKGSGPRHGILNKAQTYLYVVSELSCEVFCLDIKNGYTIIQQQSLLKEKQSGSAAAIRMSRDERFLYVSIREINRLYVIDINKWKCIQEVDCMGDHPRDMNLTPDDQFLFSLNRLSNSITVFQRSSTTGNINYRMKLEGIYEGVSIVFKEGVI